MTGRLAQLDPHRGFLRRKVRNYLIASAIIAAISAGLGWLLRTTLNELQEHVTYCSRRVVNPSLELWRALEEASAGNPVPLQQAIENTPAQALALLLDREHAPESMGKPNPLAAMSQESYHQLLRDCAAHFSLSRHEAAFELIFRQSSRLKPNADALRDRALTLLEAHPSHDVRDLLNGPAARFAQDSAFQTRRALVLRARQ